VDLLEGMAGDTGERAPLAEGGRSGEELARLGWGDGVAGRKVQAVDPGCSREREVGRRVEEEFAGGGMGAEGGAHVAGKGEELLRGKVLFAELDEVDAKGGPAGDAVKQGDALSCRLACQLGSIGDGITQHVANRSRGVLSTLSMVLSRQYTSPQTSPMIGQALVGSSRRAIHK